MSRQDLMISCVGGGGGHLVDVSLALPGPGLDRFGSKFSRPLGLGRRPRSLFLLAGSVRGSW